VLLNAAAALEVAGAAGSLAEGLEIAGRSIDSGAAAATLHRWAAVTRTG
jgi:anthranilate phosphoribosyltransferase